MSTVVSEPITRVVTRRRAGGKLIAGSAILALYVAIALLAPVIVGDPLRQDLTNRLASPSGAHWLGTDALGRDVVTRLVWAARIDLRFGLLATIVSLTIGVAVGGIAGYAGGVVDGFVMRLADVVQGFPVLVLFLSVAAATGPTAGWWFIGPGELPVLVVFSLVGWVVYARLTRGEIKRISGVDYVLAARGGGLSATRVLRRHVAPNVIPQSIVYAVVDVGLAVLALSSLSYLGLGIPLPTAEWGSMINEARPYLRDQWWLMLAPGLAIAGMGIGLALIGDALDDRLRG